MEQLILDMLVSRLAFDLRDMSDYTLNQKVELAMRTGKHSANTVAGALGDMYGLSLADRYKMMDKYSYISSVNLVYM